MVELSNEDISRMIRMEQKPASSLNKKTAYTETKSYKKLTSGQKKEFQDYVSKKGKANHIFLVLALLVYAGFGILYFNLTGNVVKEAVTMVQFSFLKYISNFLVIFTTILIILLFMHDRIRQFLFERNLKRHKKHGR